MLFISHACRGNIHDNPELIEEQDNESEEIKMINKELKNLSKTNLQ